MKTLLGDLPEFKETISVARGLHAEVADIIEENIECEQEIGEKDLEDSACAAIATALEKYADFEINNKEIRISDKEGLAQLIFGAIKDVLKDELCYTVTKQKETATKVLEVVDKFVEQNYIPEKRLMDLI